MAVKNQAASKRPPQRGKRHSAATRAAVIAALLAGQQVNDVARKFKLDSGLVSRWKAKLPEQQLQQVAAEKQLTLIEIIEAHLRASLGGATKIAEKANDSEWLGKQPVHELDAFYSTLSNTSYRILEVAGKFLGNAPSGSSAGQPPPAQLS